MLVSLFQIRRQDDPFHEYADLARQIAPMCHDEGHGERPATKIGYDLHVRSTLQAPLSIVAPLVPTPPVRNFTADKWSDSAQLLKAGDIRPN
jgi:hypothetical protein